ncbi:MAG: hypothetical protein JNN22_16645 [Rhodospirillales bacterium]|nr:hypothetical protein [Rhodospirillales bacterium]
MASEYRCILFTWRDVREALVVYSRKRGQAVPIRTPDEFKIDTESLNSELIYENGDARPERYRFDRNTLSAAMILACKDKGIRLPLKSNKQVYLLERRLALVVHIAGQEAPEFLALELAKR